MTTDIRTRRQAALVINLGSRRGRRRYPQLPDQLRAQGLDLIDVAPVTDPQQLPNALNTAAVVGAVFAVASPSTAGAAGVRLEPTSFAGASPFITPVGQDQPGMIAPANTGGQFSGDTAGLYARNAEAPSCDGQALVSALQADGQKAAAWADALNIHPVDIPGFVSTLTPVLLRGDTAVTAFGYDAPAFVSYPAVLQAGTAMSPPVTGYGQ